jgi:hypothetical protein
MSFLILERIQGQTLRDAWPTLSLPQRSQVASQTAKYCSKLAKIISLAFESATHSGVVEPFLTPAAESSHPSWKPRPLGPLSLSDFTSYISRQWTTCPNIGSCLQPNFADLGPGNFIVQEGNLVGILDWEAAGFYPRFWIASKVKLSAGFPLSSTEGTERFTWRDLLESMLKNEGFEPAIYML